MFEKNNEIVKVYGNGKLMSAKLLRMNNSRKKNFNEPDFVEKVKIEIATFGANANANGSKIQSQVDAFLDLEDVPVLANILKTYAMKAIETEFAIQQGLIQQKPASVKIYSRYGGTTENGQVISRSFEIVTGGPTMRADFMVTGEEAPGVKGDKGQIIRQQGAKSIKKVSLALKADTAMTIACALERAVSIFDIWTANGTVQENFERMFQKKSDNVASQNANNGYSQDRGFMQNDQMPGYSDDYGRGYDNGYSQGYAPQGGYAAQGAGYAAGQGIQAGYNGFI